jgi:hypothetical protein
VAATYQIDPGNSSRQVVFKYIKLKTFSSMSGPLYPRPFRPLHRDGFAQVA